MKRLTDLPEPSALIFDLDGTLVDTVATRIAAWLQTFAEERIPAAKDEVAALIGSDGKMLARDIAQRTSRTLRDDDADRIDKRSGDIFDEINTHPQPTAGARSLLIALERSRLKWAIATSSLAAQTKVSIKALELPEDPQVIDGSHVEHAKPAPDLLLLAAHKLETQPADCWYVGDSIWDMRAANAAGMIGVAVPYGAATKSDLVEAGADSVTELAAVESELRARGLLSP